MRTSQFLAIAALACLLVSVQSALPTPGDCSTDTNNTFANCQSCYFDTVNGTNQFYSCAAAKTGYYLVANSTGQYNTVKCPAGFASCSLVGNNLVMGTSDPALQYWQTAPACGSNNLNATTSPFVACTANGAATCDATGNIATCADGYWYFDANTDKWPNQRPACSQYNTTTLTKTVGVWTVAAGQQCARVDGQQKIYCSACATSGGTTCNSQPWPQTGALVQWSTVTCGTGFYLTKETTGFTQSCAACLANAACPYGVLLCAENYFPVKNSLGVVTSCNACPSLGNGINTCSRTSGITCCTGYFPSQDGTTCKTCPTSDLWGIFTNEPGISACTPAAKTCLTGYTLYKDICVSNLVPFGNSASVLAYTSMMIVAIVLALF